MRCALLCIVLLSCFFLAPVAPAAEASEQELDQLMELFRVRELLRQGVQKAVTKPEFLSNSPDRRACILNVAIGPSMIEEQKARLRLVFSDAGLRQRTIAFFSSRAGSKILDWAMKPNGTLSEIKSDLSEAEYFEFGHYVDSGGRAWIDALREIRIDEARLHELVRTECQEKPLV